MKIRLRKIKISDAKELQEIRNDKKLSKYLQGSPYPYKLNDAKKSIQKGLRKDTYKFAILSDNKLVGTICLENPNTSKKSYEVGYFIGRRYWNRGIATKAVEEICKFGFNKLKLKRIWAGTLLNNPASAKVLVKSGFKKEGLLRCATYENGRYFDDIIWGKIKR